MTDPTEGAASATREAFPIEFDRAHALISFALESEVISFEGDYDGLDAQDLDDLAGSYWEAANDERILQLLGDYHGHAVYRTVAHSHQPADLGSLSKLGMMSWRRLFDECDRASDWVLERHGIAPDDDGLTEIDYDQRLETASEIEAAAAETVRELERDDADAADHGEQAEESSLRLADMDVVSEPQFHITDASVWIHELGCEAIEIEADWDNERMIVRPHDDEEEGEEEG